MREITIYQVDSFTEHIFTGNPAGVVISADGLSEQEMQHIARELNNSETAFVLSPSDDTHDVWVRYFSPTKEVPICGHATIATHYVRASIGDCGVGTFLQKAQIGILPMEIVKDSKGYEVIMTQGSITFDEPFIGDMRDNIVHALGITKSDIDLRCPIQIASTGHTKVMIGVNDLSILDTLNPNHYRLSEISAEIGCNGYFVFAFDRSDSPYLTCGRMFAPAIGINEDPVTGNANGPLGAYLIKHQLVEHNNRHFEFIARQGVHMGRAGQMRVIVTIDNQEPTQVQIAGCAVTVFKTQITLP